MTQHPAEGDEGIWPHSEKANPERLLDAVEEISPGNPQAAKLRSELHEAQKVVQAPAPAGLLLDMPETVLDGRLGDICQRRMRRFPVAYSWPSIVTVASAITPRFPQTRVNLFGGLVGPKGSGKSQAIDHSQNLMQVAPPTLLDILAGSAEGLIRKCGDATGAPRLFSPDELGHLLEKAHIQHASFSYMLNRAFYHPRFEVLMGRGQSATFDASLSILGGLVDEKFDELFGSATTAGLYDRFLLAACPGGFRFEYFPFDDSHQEELNPVPVVIDEDVWIEKACWLAEDKELEPRIVEIAIRVATICASFDGRPRLRAMDLGPARALADYQKRIRRLLKPNAGENPEGKIAYKILQVLDEYGGKYISKRELLRKINWCRYGPSTTDRALDTLHANAEIEITKGRPILVRRLDDEPNGITLPLERETHT